MIQNKFPAVGLNVGELDIVDGVEGGCNAMKLLTCMAAEGALVSGQPGD